MSFVQYLREGLEWSGKRVNYETRYNDDMDETLWDKDTGKLLFKTKDFPWPKEPGHGYLRPVGGLYWNHDDIPFIVNHYHDGSIVDMWYATKKDVEEYA